MRYGVFGCLALWSVLAFASGHAAPNAWSGTWRLDQHLSQLIEPTFIWTQASTGEYTVNTGDHTFRFFCDGKDYPTLPQHSIKCTLQSPRSMQMIYELNGVMVSQAQRTLSPNGEVLTVAATRLGSKGLRDVITASYQRTSLSTGFSGAWTDRDQANLRPPVLIITKTGTMLRLSVPSKKQYTDIPLNGTDAPIHGIPPGVHATLSLTPNGDHEFHIEQKHDGQVVRDNDLRLTPDGLTLIQETWRPDNPRNKDRLVYRRQ